MHGASREANHQEMQEDQWQGNTKNGEVQRQDNTGMACPSVLHV